MKPPDHGGLCSPAIAPRAAPNKGGLEPGLAACAPLRPACGRKCGISTLLRGKLPVVGILPWGLVLQVSSSRSPCVACDHTGLFTPRFQNPSDF